MYSHYYKGIVTTSEYEKSLEEIKFLYSIRPKVSRTAGYYYKYNRISLHNDYPKSNKPFFGESFIRFNGNPKDGLDHETFLLFKNRKVNEAIKTSRKPYDFMVCICLLSFANNCENFKFCSDGTLEDWNPAIKFYEKHYLLKPHIKEYL